MASDSLSRSRARFQIPDLCAITAKTNTKDLMQRLRLQSGVPLSQKTANRVKQDLAGDTKQGHIDSFQRLPAYLEECKRVDPEGSYDVRLPL